MQTQIEELLGSRAALNKDLKGVQDRLEKLEEEIKDIKRRKGSKMEKENTA